MCEFHRCYSRGCDAQAAIARIVPVDPFKPQGPQTIVRLCEDHKPEWKPWERYEKALGAIARGATRGN